MTARPAGQRVVVNFTVHIRQQVLRRGKRTLIGKSHRGPGLRHRRFADLLDLVLRRHPFLNQLLAEIADRIKSMVELEIIDTGGVGGTLAGNALSLAAMRATLTQVLTQENFDRMIDLGTRWSDGVDAAIDEFDLPWTCNRLGARGEYMFGKVAPVTGADANNAGDFELEQYIHLRMLNDGFLITPFHNMALMCPDTTSADVDAHTKAFYVMCEELVSP